MGLQYFVTVWRYSYHDGLPCVCFAMLFYLFFLNTVLGVQPNFATCWEVSQIWKGRPKCGVPSPWTVMAPKLPIFGWFYDNI